MVNINKNIIGMYSMYTSLILRSYGICFIFLVAKPNTESNQHLEKPISPKTLAIKKIKKHITKETSNNPQNM